MTFPFQATSALDSQSEAVVQEADPVPDSWRDSIRDVNGEGFFCV